MDAQRWSITVYSARPEPLPGEATNDQAVRANTYNRDLWRALTELSTAFMRAAGQVGRLALSTRREAAAAKARPQRWLPHLRAVPPPA